ncbi:MAG: cupin [Acidimicrobiia bacterium]|nr:MAG: cupin [Acidimicrobiia bacterium]
MTDNPHVFFLDDDAFKEVRPGFRRRIFNGDNVSLCFWRIKGGVAPTPYDGHPDNEQFGLILAGKLDFRIGSDERVVLGPGDVYYAPRNLPHGDSRFIGDPERGDEVWIMDIFSPVREEYRNG